MTMRLPLSQGLAALIDDCDWLRVSAFHWCAERSYPPIIYAVRKCPESKKLIRLHRFIMQPAKGLEVDHLNGDGLDNRRSNLRICTRGQNARNQRLCVASTTGFKGVSFDRERKKFSAKINTAGSTLHLGRFENPKDAARAYDVKARELFGAFARTNFPC